MVQLYVKFGTERACDFSGICLQSAIHLISTSSQYLGYVPDQYSLRGLDCVLKPSLIKG